MASIPTGVILVWTGTNASIPGDWTRETTLDGKYPKATADAVNPNQTGGSNTHEHTSTTHGHTLNSHSHNVVLAQYTGSNSAGSSADNLSANHGHSSAAIDGTSGGSLQDTVVTWVSVNQEPPYYDVIFIKPSGASASVSDDVCIFWNSVTPPTNFNHCDGDNGTPDLRNKYLKGATTAGDSGGTGGGTSHSHTVTHGHTANTHTHSGSSGASDTATTRDQNGSNGANRVHTHTITLAGTAAAVDNYVKENAGSGDTVEVAYKKLGVVQNTSGGTLSPQLGSIGMWLGTLANIPADWQVCDGTNDTPDLRDKFIKTINTTGELEDTGGSNTHTHTQVSHTHVAAGTHTHSGSTGGPSATTNRSPGSDNYATENHTHTLGSVSSPTAVYANTNLDSGNTVDLQPAYRTVAYIQLLTAVGGGGPILTALAQNDM